MEGLDNTILNVYLKIGSFCGITPPGKQSTWNATYHYYYSLFLFIALSTFSIVSIYGNVLYHHPSMSKPEILVDSFTCSFLVMQGSTIALSYLTQPKRWGVFVRKIQENFSGGNGKKWYYPFLLLVFAHCVLFSKILWEWIAWFPIVGISVRKNYVFRMVDEYYAMFITCFIVRVNAILKHRFSGLNKLLKQSKFKCYQIRHVQTQYRKLVDVIEDFNAIFGYSILFITANTICVILEGFQNILIYRNMETQKKRMVFIWCALSVFLVTVRNLQNDYSLFIRN